MIELCPRCGKNLALVGVHASMRSAADARAEGEGGDGKIV